MSLSLRGSSRPVAGLCFLWLLLLSCLPSGSMLWAQGIAPPLLFSGSATVIAPPSADTEYAFGPRDFGALYRTADCAVEGIIATANGGSSPTFKVLTVVSDYEDTLHKLAGLTTTGDVWPEGCANPGANNPAYFAADAGQASNHSYVIATIDTVDPNALDIYNVTVTLMKQKVTKAQSFTIGPNVYPIAAVDLNGDGLADLIVGCSGNFSPVVDGGYAVLINKGDGTFDAPTFVSLSGEGIIAMAVVDVNHDLKPDLIALEQAPNGGHNQVSVFLGDGKGGFTAKASYSLTALAYNLLVADMNSDGYPDIVLANGTVLLGNGDGTFTAGESLPLPSSTVSFVAADFNRDKKIDLAVVTYNDQVAVYVGNGDGTLQAPTWYSGIYSAQVISAADLDGDGNLDLILGAQSGGGMSPSPSNMAGTGGLGVLMGAGDGTFKGAVGYATGGGLSNTPFAVADITGDGKPDILTPSSLLVGDGTGHFTAKTGTQFPGLTSSVGVIRVADLNNDKKNDAVVTTTDALGNPSTAYVFLGQAGGKFKAGKKISVENVLDVAIADFNGDNIPDLALLSYAPGVGISVHVLLGTGNGSYDDSLSVPLPAGVGQSTGGRIFAADFNNDKKMDLVVLDVGNYLKSASGATYLLLGNGSGIFTLSTTITSVKNPFDAAIADFNKDGKLDLVVSSTDFSGSLSTPPQIFLGTGKGKFGAGKPLPTVSTIPLHLAAADFDGDGKTDLIIGNCCGLAVTSVLFGKGNGSFAPEQIMQVAEAPSQIVVADLNGDLRPDVVIEGGNAPGMVFILMNEYGVVSDSDGPLLEIRDNK